MLQIEDIGSAETAGARIKGVYFDRRDRMLARGLRERRILPTDARLLDVFLAHPGEVLSRERLRDAVWPPEAAVQLRTIDVQIGRLRKAFRYLDERHAIITVRGAGYLLQIA